MVSPRELGIQERHECESNQAHIAHDDLESLARLQPQPRPGVFLFGLLLLLISLHGSSFQDLGFLKPIAVLGSFGYFMMALRFWFFAPAIGTGLGFACFVASLF